MNKPTQSPAIMPLVRSIGNEVAERLDALIVLEGYILRDDDYTQNPFLYSLVADEAVAHERALDKAYEELSELGCSVLSEAPVTLRIGPAEGEDFRSIVCQFDAPGR
jgi:hypothetical protein